MANWAEVKEAGGPGRFRFMIFVSKYFPVWVMRLLVFPIGSFYWLVALKARRISRQFFNRVATFRCEQKSGRWATWFHVLSFSLALTEKVQGWGNRIPHDHVRFFGDTDDLVERLASGRGAYVITSHLGNAELMRALSRQRRGMINRNFPVVTIVDFVVTAGFNNMLKALNPESVQRMINADDIGIATVGELEDCVSRGGMVVIAGDRLPRKAALGEAGTAGKLSIPFLGADADFPEGPFYLAGLLGAPVYFLFGLRLRALNLSARYNMYVYKSDIAFDCSRKERKARVAQMAADFAAKLEAHCAKQPEQWYNFYDFWARAGGEKC
jgi:predicted LPLAT superfamily acyltransferase